MSTFSIQISSNVPYSQPKIPYFPHFSNSNSEQSPQKFPSPENSPPKSLKLESTWRTATPAVLNFSRKFPHANDSLVKIRQRRRGVVGLGRGEGGENGAILITSQNSSTLGATSESRIQFRGEGAGSLLAPAVAIKNEIRRGTLRDVENRGLIFSVIGEQSRATIVQLDRKIAR